MARTGRRPGNQDTREEILEAARRGFAEKGYDGTSIRFIATGAGVDPALVHHYFGNKDKLFLAAMRVPFDPGEIIPQAMAGGRDQFGERLIRLLLTVWESPGGPALAGFLRSAVAHEWMARMLREFLVTQVLRRVFGHLELDPKEAPIRASLVASQILGLAVARYVIKIEPLASLPHDVLVTMIGANIQRYIDGPLPPQDAL